MPSTPRNAKAFVMVAYLDLEVFAETDVVSYTIEA